MICIIFGLHQICFNVYNTYTNADKCMHNYINKVHPTLVIWLGIIQFRTKHGSSSNAKLIEILLRILNNQTKTRYIRNNTYMVSCKLVTKKPNKPRLIFSLWTYFFFCSFEYISEFQLSWIVERTICCPKFYFNCLIQTA